MLTRLEIDGFKTFRDFALDAPQFLVVLGGNASGKSNLFDAIQFLRASTDGTLLEAPQQMRGDVLELFHRHVDGTQRDRMTFAAEVLVPSRLPTPSGTLSTCRILGCGMSWSLSCVLPIGGGAYVAEENLRLVKRTKDRWVRQMPADTPCGLPVG